MSEPTPPDDLPKQVPPRPDHARAHGPDAIAGQPIGAQQPSPERGQSPAKEQMEILHALSQMSDAELEATLAKAPPEQRAQILADVEQYRRMRQIAQEGNIDEGHAEGSSLSGEEEHEEVAESPFKRTFEEAVTMAEEGNAKEAAEKLSVPEDVFETYHFTYKKIGENETLSPEVENQIVQKWTELGLPGMRDGAEQFIKVMHPQLNETDKERLLARLDAIQVDESKAEQEGTQLDEGQMQAVSKAIPEALEKLNAEADQAAAELPTDMNTLTEEQQEEVKAQRQRIIAHKGKIASLSEKLQGYFADGEPGRKYARIGGKVLYYAILTAFVLLIMEMNMINKAASTGGGRGRGR